MTSKYDDYNRDLGIHYDDVKDRREFQTRQIDADNKALSDMEALKSLDRRIGANSPSSPQEPARTADPSTTLQGLSMELCTSLLKFDGELRGLLEEELDNQKKKKLLTLRTLCSEAFRQAETLSIKLRQC